MMKHVPLQVLTSVDGQFYLGKVLEDGSSVCLSGRFPTKQGADWALGMWNKVRENNARCKELELELVEALNALEEM